MFKILVSRTDNIGDVILTLPMLGIIKNHYPDCSLYFLGSNYTQPIAARCEHIDHFIAVEELTLDSLKTLELDVFIHVYPKKYLAVLAKKAGIPVRIGTSHRLYHWSTCNKRISFTRINSHSHEAILNLNLLEPLEISNDYSLDDLIDYTGWMTKQIKHEELDEDKCNIIFHMKSNGNAVEWPVKDFMSLSKLMPEDTYSIYLTGTQSEKELIESECPAILERVNVKDMMGQFGLDEFIDFVGSSDGLIACSTGSLHISSANGVNTLGLYPKKRPMHSGRWSPIGRKTQIIDSDLVVKENKMILELNPSDVLRVIKKWKNNR